VRREGNKKYKIHVERSQGWSSSQPIPGGLLSSKSCTPSGVRAVFFACEAKRRRKKKTTTQTQYIYFLLLKHLFCTLFFLHVNFTETRTVVRAVEASSQAERVCRVPGAADSHYM
jgi:hypothetical protein